MHKYVVSFRTSSVQLADLFTAQISQHIFCGGFIALCAICTHRFRTVYTHVFTFFDLLITGFTQYTQALLQKLLINKLLIEG